MRRLRRAIVLALATSLVVPLPAAADVPAPPSTWYALPGLDAGTGAKWVRSLAHSTPPTTVFAGLEGGGVFRSTNGGATWSPFNAGFPTPSTTRVRALLSSAGGTTVHAATERGVWRSTGGAWQPLGQGAGPSKLNGSVQALAALPGNVLLAGVASGGVWKSSDGGATWKAPAAGNGMPSSETPRGFVAYPAGAPAFVLAATANGVFRSSDGGERWTLVSDGIPALAAPNQVWVDVTAPSALYASTAANGVYRSSNGGVTWAPVNGGLGAASVRGFQIFSAAEGSHLYATTENGLWHAFDGGATSALDWTSATQAGLLGHTDMWALTAPVIPGSGAPGLIAGSSTNGGYYLGFQPPSSTCPSNHTTNTTASCPRIVDTTPATGQTLTALNGSWSGTPLFDFAYQWQECSAATADSCVSIPGAEETSLIVPVGSTARYRVVVTASNAAPSFDTVVRTSAITSTTTGGSGFPGSVQRQAPSIVVTPPGTVDVGDSLFAASGTLTATDPVYGWFNPPAPSPAFQWLRCELGGGDCEEIPGATGRTYEPTVADGAHGVAVRVTGTNASGSSELTSSSVDVVSAPAAVAPPFSDPAGGPAKSQAPAIVGNAWVGETVAGTVGGWQDPTTEFRRSWLRCDAGGAACTAIGQSGPTYVVRADDLGRTLRMRVTADVNGDLGDDGVDGSPPSAVQVTTAATAPVAVKPRPGSSDTVAPVISRLSVTNKRFAVAKRRTPLTARARKGTAFKFRLSERATVRIAIDRLAAGRKVGRKCRRPSRGNRGRKRCERTVRVGRLTRRDRAAGKVAVAFTGRIGARKLAPGRYRATLVATDAARNASRPARVKLKIVRR